MGFLLRSKFANWRKEPLQAVLLDKLRIGQACCVLRCKDAGKEEMKQVLRLKGRSVCLWRELAVALECEVANWNAHGIHGCSALRGGCVF